MSERPTDRKIRNQWLQAHAILRPMYDACGCIYPCPDHKSPKQDGTRDREYWNDQYDTEQVATVDQEED